MDLIILAIALFLVGMLLIFGILYLFLAPSKDRNLRTRLEAIRVPEYDYDPDDETNLLRQDVLSQYPALNRILARFPIAFKFNLFIQ